MTKTELHSQVSAVLEKYNVKQSAREEILALLEVKKGGVKANPEEFTVFNADGSQAFIQCAVTGLWFAVNSDNFYLSEGVVKYRTSKHGERLKKELVKANKASKDAILNDVINGVITPEQGKAAVEALSDVIVIPQEVKDLGFADRPVL